MCGISGFSWADRALIARMNGAQCNRGPDGEGVFVDENVSLGHRRLAIIDLSEAANQPMSDECSGSVIVYNGEVYNFRSLRDGLKARGFSFRTDCDTEVVLKSYLAGGLAALNNFNGMWAFCIYDKARHSLVLARDQFGIKPLYYSLQGGRLIFASTITPLLEHVKTEPDSKAIAAHLAFGLQDHTEDTFFSGIKKLPPEMALVYDLRTRMAEFKTWRKRPQGEAAGGESLLELLRESVSLRTVADVPVGCCLSGGLDSSAVAKLLNESLQYRFSLFSYVAPGFRLDESANVRAAARGLNAESFTVSITPSELLADADDFVAALEEPSATLSPYAQYRVMKLAHERGAKVLLDGQGADELFAGYHMYFRYYLNGLLLRGDAAGFARQAWAYFRNCGSTSEVQMALFMLLPTDVKRKVWLRRELPWLDEGFLGKQFPSWTDPRWERCGAGEFLDRTFFSLRLPLFLKWEDKNSMRWSVESRVPFLDQKLVEFSQRLAFGDKLRDGTTKLALRRALSGVLPDEIVWRRDKVGFAADSERLFGDKAVLGFCRDVIGSASFKSRPWWRWDRVSGALDRHCSGEKPCADQIWKWVHLELWLRKFFPQHTGE